MAGSSAATRRLRRVGDALLPAAASGGQPQDNLVRTLRRPSWKDSFPPKELVLAGDNAKVAEWLAAHVPAMLPPDATCTERERQLARLSAGEYIAMRKAGEVSCEEYAVALTKRWSHYSYLNTHMHMDNMPQQPAYVVEQAKTLDRKAAESGVDAIAPLYGLLVPAKGTMATTDFPSSAGHGLLHDCYANQDADFVALLRDKHAVIMGKTNVPEFAASGVTANYANGRTINPYDHTLIPGGSSGGSGAAVAAYLAPIAVTEDTGGSTRLPAFFNHNVGYDPSRNHYPNAGNPGMTFTNDQIGLNARSLDDILLLDAALLGLEAEHAAALAAAPSAGEIRVGLPQWPFVEFTVPDGCVKPDYMSQFDGIRVTEQLEAKYTAAGQVLQQAGVTLVREEWEEVAATHREGTMNALADVTIGRVVNGQPVDTGLTNAVHSFTGQMAEWVSTFLEAPVSLIDLINDTHALGAAHDPAAFMKRPRETDESQFRYVSAIQAETVEIYNKYFDDNGVSCIMMPALLADACSYEDMAGDTCPVRALIDGEWQDAVGSYWLSMYTTMNTLKNIPVPKLVVPTGLDSTGRPTAVQIWGRATPADQLYEDDFARTADLDFLYTAKVLLEAIQAEPALARVDAPLVADLV